MKKYRTAKIGRMLRFYLDDGISSRRFYISKITKKFIELSSFWHDKYFRVRDYNPIKIKVTWNDFFNKCKLYKN